MANNGFVVDNMSLLMFASNYPSYSLFKEVAMCLNVPVVSILGAYDYELLSLSFIMELLNDIGIHAYMDHMMHHKYDYEPCINPNVGKQGYINQYNNDKNFKKAQAETGLRCPEIKILNTDLAQH